MAFSTKAPVAPPPEPGLDVQLGDAFDSMFWKQQAFQKDPELAQVVADLEAAGHPVSAQDWVAAANQGQAPPDNPMKGMAGGLAGSLPGALVGLLMGGPAGLLAGGAVSALGARMGSQMANPGEAGGSVLPDLLGAVAPRALGSVAGRLAGSKLTGGVAKAGLSKVSQGLGTIGGPNGIRAAASQPGLVSQLLAKHAASKTAAATTKTAAATTKTAAATTKTAAAKVAGKPTAKGVATKRAAKKAAQVEPDDALQLSKLALKWEPKADTPMFSQWPVTANKWVKELGQQAVTGDDPELVQKTSSLLSSATPKVREMALSRIQYGTDAVPVTMREMIAILERDVMREMKDEILKRSAVNQGVWKPTR